MDSTAGIFTAFYLQAVIMTRTIRFLVVLIPALLFSQQALAFRCGSKLVTEGIHEQVVRKLCGEPTSVRHLGYAVRPYILDTRRQGLGGLSSNRYQGTGHLIQEVLVTEYVYNFGPRKLMRRLVFEDGILITIETLGSGYLEDER